jgi:hypothetical protein
VKDHAQTAERPVEPGSTPMFRSEHPVRPSGEAPPTPFERTPMTNPTTLTLLAAPQTVTTYQAVTATLLIVSLTAFAYLALPDVRDAVRARRLERGGRR